MGGIMRHELSDQRLQHLVKRLLDIIISGFLLLLLSPLFIVFALLIRLTSKGPIIFRHKRVGKDEKPFYLLKFRTMVSGGDDSQYMRYLKQLIESERDSIPQLHPDTKPNGNGLPYMKMGNDPRVTPIGEFLRKYYLDELPQLWNILKGEMSLVGPRPHVQFEVDYYEPDQCRRLSVPPGATGLWQVSGKADCTFNELIALDLAYIDNWSLLFDLEILLKTIVLMLRGGEGFWARMVKKIPSKRNERYLVKQEISFSQEPVANKEQQHSTIDVVGIDTMPNYKSIETERTSR
jgi:lipopolysaccharide/colanic/teichoic acid biosynthesis glycosyltransferase